MFIVIIYSLMNNQNVNVKACESVKAWDKLASPEFTCGSAVSQHVRT